jgi:hypothetical protein
MIRTSGVLWGVNWERHELGVTCYAMGGNFYLVSRKYAGNGSERVSVRDSVKAFRRDVLGVAQ